MDDLIPNVIACVVGLIVIVLTIYALASGSGPPPPPQDCKHTPTFHKAEACTGADLSEQRDTPGR